MKKHTLFALLGAGTLALSASVGFAAWTINARDAKDNASINVSADGTVNDNRIEISKSGAGTTSGFASNSKLAFGAAKNTEIKDPWLSADFTPSEQLSLTYNLYVKGKTGLASKLSVSGSVVDEGDKGEKKYDALAAKDVAIVGNLPTINGGVEFTVQNTGEAESTYYASISLTFSWGTKFTSSTSHTIVNPYTYYNEKPYDDSLADDAKTTLSKLKDLNGYTGLKFEFTVSVAA